MRGLRRGAFLALAWAGCGRIGFDARATATDGGGDDGGDAACAFGPWSAPTLLAALGRPVAGTAISTDGLTLFLESVNGPSVDLYVARRPSRTASFGAAALLPELSTADLEADPMPATDGLELFFTRITAGNACIERATRSTTAGPWIDAGQVSELCTSSEAGGPYLAPDGLTLYYNTVTPDTLMVATRPSKGALFAAGTPVPGIQTSAANGYPWVASDGLTIYYESGVPQDLWQASRATTSDAFGAPTKLPFDTAAVEEDVSLSPDGLELYFSSDRVTNGADDAYVVTRACL